MGNSKCKHENCNALEYRTSGYCLKHKKAAPESIFIVTSNLDEEGNQIQKNNHQSSDNVVNNKSDYSSKKKNKLFYHLNQVQVMRQLGFLAFLDFVF